MTSELKKVLAQLEEHNKILDGISRNQQIINEKLNLALPTGKFVPYTDFEALPQMKWIEFWKGTTGIKLPTESPDIMRFYCEYVPTPEVEEEVLPHYHDCLEKLITLEGQLYRIINDEPIAEITIEPPFQMHSFAVKVFTKAIVEFYRPSPKGE